MLPLDLSAIEELLRRERKRPSYIVTLLEFQLGRTPTQEEVDAVKHDDQLNRELRRRWLETQPLRVRFTREERIKRIMQQRYNVPEWLITSLLDEVVDEW